MSHCNTQYEICNTEMNNIMTIE